VHLVWLELRDFRCYEQLRFEPDPGINLLVGENGSGKTSVLEGLAYLSRLKSFRRVADDALVRHDAAATVVRGGFSREGGESLVEVELPSTGRRRVLVNGKRPARYGAVAGEIPVVTFLPDDLDLVKRGPALRREYLDDLSGQLWPAAAAEQQEYDRVLRQRNALLRVEGREADTVTLGVWDERLAAAGARVVLRRATVARAAVPRLKALYGEFGPSRDRLALDYAGKGVGTIDAGMTEAAVTAQLREAVAERRNVDMERRTTTIGPHRDEPDLRLGRREVRTQASQGEQRAVALALRLATYELLEERQGRPPILLLDDVFSELDAVRADAVVARLPGSQVLITTAREEDVPVSGRRWNVAGGGVS